MKDFIVARFGNTYGYLSTDKEHNSGFSLSYKDTIETLEKKYGDFTYANPEELPVHEHQREWTKKDRIYLNKLKFLKDIDDIQYARILSIGQGYDR